MPPYLSEILSFIKLSLRFKYKLGQKYWVKNVDFFFLPLWKRTYICIVMMFNANACGKGGNNCSTFVSFSRRKHKKQSGINDC